MDELYNLAHAWADEIFASPANENQTETNDALGHVGDEEPDTDEDLANEESMEGDSEEENAANRNQADYAICSSSIHRK